MGFPAPARLVAPVIDNRSCRANRLLLALSLRLSRNEQLSPSAPPSFRFFDVDVELSAPGGLLYVIS